MSEIKGELKEFILNSALTNEQKNLWSNFINLIKEEDVSTMLETIKEDPEVLDFLTNNIEEKTNLIKNKDIESLNNTIKKEKDFIIKKDN